MWLSDKSKRLNLALQGGGAHGAFTWGVLDQLLCDKQIELSWISGSSAGAINAIAVAHGLAKGGRQAARDTLQAIWSEVESAHVPDLLRFNPVLSSLARSASGMFSPYSFNPLGFDPLRKIIAQHIDFDAIRANKSVNVMIAATEVATGRARIFAGDELSIEAVLASACLPMLHHAVEIDGRAYWDGGFSANPDLLSLASNSPVGDTLLVLLNPVSTLKIPRTAVAIEDRINTITFNQPLLRDVDAIVAAKQETLGWFAPRNRGVACLKAHRFHLIEAAEHTAELNPDTKVTPDRDVLSALHQAGRCEAEQWLAAHKDLVGKRSTVDLYEHFVAPRLDAGVNQLPDDGAELSLARSA